MEGTADREDAVTIWGTIMEPVHKQPEQIQEEYREFQRQADLQYKAHRKTLIRRWVWAAAAMGFLSSIVNYLGITYASIAHLLVCGALGFALLHFKRGHLSGIISFCFVNVSISFLAGVFNPLGMIAFSVSGALIGLGMRIDEHQ
jgi:hypothetical protein